MIPQEEMANDMHAIDMDDTEAAPPHSSAGVQSGAKFLLGRRRAVELAAAANANYSKQAASQFTRDEAEKRARQGDPGWIQVWSARVGVQWRIDEERNRSLYRRPIRWWNARMHTLSQIGEHGFMEWLVFLSTSPLRPLLRRWYLIKRMLTVLALVTLLVFGLRWGGAASRRSNALYAMPATRDNDTIVLLEEPSNVYQPPEQPQLPSTGDVEFEMRVPPLAVYHASMAAACERVDLDALEDHASHAAVLMEILIHACRTHCVERKFLGVTPRHFNQSACIMYMADAGDGAPLIMLNPMLVNLSSQQQRRNERSSLFPERGFHVATRPETVMFSYDEAVPSGKQYHVKRRQRHSFSSVEAFVAHALYEVLGGVESK